MTTRLLRWRALAKPPGAVLHGDLALRLPCCGAPTSPAATETSVLSRCPSCPSPRDLRMRLGQQRAQVVLNRSRV